MHTRALELLVGFFVCLGVAAVFVLTFRVASLDTVSGGASYHVTAKFDTIGGLARGASVKMAGVKIGRVANIAIDPNTYQAVATLEIQASQNHIPQDSTAKILTAGLLGEQYIGMDGGGDDHMLKDGDRLMITQSAVVLEKIIGQFLYGKAAETGTKKEK